MPLFNKKDFDGMRFNVFGLEEENESSLKTTFLTEVQLKYKEIPQALKGIDSYKKPDKQKLIRYILYMYDKDSPMRIFYPDTGKRKEECAILAHYNLKRDAEQLEIVFSLRDELISEIVSNWIVWQSSMIWSSYMTSTQMYWEYQREMMKGIIDFKDDKQLMDAMNAKAKLLKTSDELIISIESYERRLNQGDDALKEVLDFKRRRITSPELFAHNTNLHIPKL
jgi:hypothetical protein